MRRTKFSYYNDDLLHDNEKNSLPIFVHLHLNQIQKSNIMKAKKILVALILAVFFSGCVVYSFYPLYTEKDLFPNDILTGVYSDGEGTTWTFEHPYKGEKIPKKLDRTSYILHTIDKDNKESKFSVHIIKLGEFYFVDFYLDDFLEDDDIDLSSFHIVPVHTFAKLTITDDELIFNWFDPDWLKKLIDENKIRIRHEDNGDYILLTAKPGELQKFVTKYEETEEAFEDGVDATLKRNK